MSTRMHYHMQSSAAWSQVRASLFFTARADGLIEAWELGSGLQRPECAYKLDIGGTPLALCAHPEGRTYACGGTAGKIALLQVSTDLASPAGAQDVGEGHGRVSITELLLRASESVEFAARMRDEDRHRSVASAPEDGTIEASEQESAAIERQADNHFWDVLKERGAV